VVLTDGSRPPDKGQVMLSPIEQAIALASALHK
jgi:hypothetical protein